MSPTQFHLDHHHNNQDLKQNTNLNNNFNNGCKGGAICPPSSLKMRKESHMIKKSSSSSPTSSSSSGSVSSLVGPAPKPHCHQQQRGPVIIYTHSPKVIHTHPKDFMALVQKLTGMSRSEDVDPTIGSKKADDRGSHLTNMVKTGIPGNLNNNNNNSSSNNNNNNNDDNESSSVITDENCSSSNTGEVGVGPLTPCVGPSIFDPPPAAPPPLPGPFLSGLPFYNMANSSSDLLCCGGADPPLYDHMDFNFHYNNHIT